MERTDRRAGDVQTLTLPGGARLELVWVPGGVFRMGALTEDGEAAENEKPVHPVRVSGRWMGRTPVTQAQWKSVLGTEPSCFPGLERPVERVSWLDAQAFLERVGHGLRLPTEAEWEHAARAGEAQPPALEERAWYASNSGARFLDSDALWSREACRYFEALRANQNRTQPVGLKKPNAYGLQDTLGQVWEWCQDAYLKDAYRTRPQGAVTDNPLVDLHGATHGRVTRGGAWDCWTSYMRVSRRDWFVPEHRANNQGFRVCLPESP